MALGFLSGCATLGEVTAELRARCAEMVGKRGQPSITAMRKRKA